MANVERTNRQPETLRATLHKEMREHMAFRESREDSTAYTYAAEALKSFAERGLGAANAVEKELERQKTLKNDDPKKMSPEEVLRWERMLTEVETWTLTIPKLLQQSRVVQNNPLVRDQLWDIFRVIHQRDQMLDAIDGLRFRALKGSDKNPFSPFVNAVPPEFYELSVIATTQWFIRENVRIHPHLLNPNRRADLQLHIEALQILADTEHEGEWAVDKPQALDAFIRGKFNTAFFRKTLAEQTNADERLKKLFTEGRVRVNGVVEKETPSRQVKAGDKITIVTSFFVSTERVGVEMQAAKQMTKEERAKLNANRATQNLPAAAEFAFNVRDSMDVWKRLLVDVGGEKDHKRYARQLRTDVERFDADFMQKKSLEVFKTDALRQLKEAKNDNKKAKQMYKFFTWFLGDTLSDRLTTSPEELQEIFDKVMKKMEESYESVASAENSATIKEFTRLLQRIEEGKVVDPVRLEKYLTLYGKIILQAGHTMTALQAWQVSENVQRVGGQGKANNLELVTRVNNKSFGQWLSGFSPYGSLKTLSYADKDGRIIIMDPGPSFSERSWSHIWETGKLGVQNAALSVILTHIFTKIHYLVILAPGLHGLVKSVGGKVAGPATAVIIAEFTLYQTKEAARCQRMKISAGIVEDAVLGLQKLQQDEKIPTVLKEVSARKHAAKIRSELAVLLHASQGESDLAQLKSGKRDTDIRPDLFLEAHVYTNQILTAVGFPPLAELAASGKGSLPESVDALRKQVKEMGYKPNISPELIEYIEARLADERLMKNRKEIIKLRRELEEVKSATRSGLYTLKHDVERKPRKSKMRRFIDGEYYPSSGTVAIQAGMLVKVSNSAEMDKEYAERTSTAEKQEALLKFALDVILFDHEIKMELHSNVKYKAKPGYGWLAWIPGPHQYIPAEYKGDQRRILSSSTKNSWNAKAQKLIRVPMAKVLATSRYLAENTPSSKAIEDLLSSSNATKISKLAGGKAMAGQFRARWALLRQYADKYAPPEKAVSDEPSMEWDSEIGGYSGEYKEYKDVKAKFIMIPWSGGKSFSKKLTYPDKKHGYKIIITDTSNLEDWGGHREWTIWGATFYENKKFPEKARHRILTLLTVPAKKSIRDSSSIERVLDLFPINYTARKALLGKLLLMYRESFRKQNFLKELFLSARRHNGKITEKNWQSIYSDMRTMQEWGAFGYSPNVEKR